MALVTGLLLLGTGQAAAAGDANHLSGGTASIPQVAMNVTVDGAGAASGSFDCLMAGRSGLVLGAFGLVHNMIVHATWGRPPLGPPPAPSGGVQLAQQTTPARLRFRLEVAAHGWATTSTTITAYSARASTVIQ